MKGFELVDDEELVTVTGRGGGSKPQSPPASPSKPAATPSSLSSLETARVGKVEVARAQQLVTLGAGYGSQNVSGVVNPMNATSYDCAGAQSAVAGKAHLTTAQLLDAKQAAAAGYIAAGSNSQPGTWTVVQYKDPATNKVVGHTQMTMGNGQYFDSVPGSATSPPQGPSLTSNSTLDYLNKKGIKAESVAYIRPGN